MSTINRKLQEKVELARKALTRTHMSLLKATKRLKIQVSESDIGCYKNEKIHIYGYFEYMMSYLM